ncbi:MAG: hypothetical protein ACK5YZ_00295 [bacterium]|jgi:hypothetical protein
MKALSLGQLYETIKLPVLEGLRLVGCAKHSAALQAVLIASLCGAIILLTVEPNLDRLSHFRPEQVELYAVKDSYPQRLAYLVFLGVLLAGAATARWWEGVIGRANFTAIALLALSILLAFATIPKMILGLAVGAIIVALLVWSSLLAHITALAVLCFYLFPVIFRPAVPDPAIFVWIDMHYAAVLGHGQRIAAGLKPYTETLPSYGLLPAMLMSLAPQGISFAWMVLLVQWSQVIFAFLMIVALRLAIGPHQRRLFWAAAAITLLALLPFLSTNGLPIWFPNQTGVRFLFLPIAMITVLLSFSKLNWGAALVFGAVGGLSVVHNVETGLMISAALGLTLLCGLAQASLRTILIAALSGLSGALAVLFATSVFVVMRTDSGYEELIAPILGLFKLFLGGFGGLKLRLTPVFVLILLHASYLVFIGVRAAFRREAPFDACLLFAASFILLWFPYYVNRPDAWNLWSFVAVYCVLLARTAILVPASRLPAGVASAILIAFSLMNLQTLLPLSMVNRSPPRGSTACLDGLFAPAALCLALRQRADYIRHVSSEDIVWLTHIPLQTMRMSGDVGRLQKIDFISLIISQQDFDTFIAALSRIRPAIILVDQPDSSLQVPDGMMKITEELLAALAGEYCHGDDADGWGVYRRCDVR